MNFKKRLYNHKLVTSLLCAFFGGIAATNAATIFQTVNGGTWSSATWGSPAANPSGGNDYISDGATMATLVTGVNSSGHTFAGSSLTLRNGVNFRVGRNAGANYILESGASVTAVANRNFAGTALVASGQATTFDAGNFTLTLTASIAGGGAIAIAGGTGSVVVAHVANTFTGNWTVSSGTLNLQDNAVMNFSIGANGVNNSIGGAGILSLSGDFIFNLSGAVAVNGNSWQIVNVGSLNETFTGTFSVQGFTETANVWTNGSGYSFSESTGLLTYTAVPEPSVCFLLLGGLSLLGARRVREGNLQASDLRV